MSTHTRIRQIVPAVPGWSAAYAIEQGGKAVWESLLPIPLWLLVEEWICPLGYCPATIGQSCPEEEEHAGFVSVVSPAVADDAYLYPASEDGNFLCILGPDDANPGQKAEAALRHYERHRRRRQEAKQEEPES